MKNFKILLIILTLVILIGCKKNIDTSAKEPNWDRTSCERCVMQLSDRLHSAQIVNIKDGSRYYFDDIGCAFLWFDEHRPELENNVIIYVTDGKDASWIDSNTAVFATKYMTPMNFGVAAFKNKSDIEADKTIVTKDEAVAQFKMRMEKHKK